MNAFEDIVAQYLGTQGYWVKQSVKVEISKEDKRNLGKPSMPRPEIDLVALNMKENELLLIEVKSYFDSYGVYYEAVSGTGTSKREKEDTERYRLLTDIDFRKLITKRLREQFIKEGFMDINTRVNYALAAGKIHSKRDEEKINAYFLKKGWILFSPSNIKGKMKELSEKGWEDNIITITSKLIMRE